MDRLEIQTLENESYKELPGISTEFNLDFDDAYQIKVAQENNLTIVTMDRDFDKAKDSLPIVFLWIWNLTNELTKLTN